MEGREWKPMITTNQLVWLCGFLVLMIAIVLNPKVQFPFHTDHPTDHHPIPTTSKPSRTFPAVKDLPSEKWDELIAKLESEMATLISTEDISAWNASFTEAVKTQIKLEAEVQENKRNSIAQPILQRYDSLEAYAKALSQRVTVQQEIRESLSSSKLVSTNKRNKLKQLLEEYENERILLASSLNETENVRSKIADLRKKKIESETKIASFTQQISNQKNEMVKLEEDIMAADIGLQEVVNKLNQRRSLIKDYKSNLEKCEEDHRRLLETEKALKKEEGIIRPEEKQFEEKSATLQQKIDKEKQKHISVDMKLQMYESYMNELTSLIKPNDRESTINHLLQINSNQLDEVKKELQELLEQQQQYSHHKNGEGEDDEMVSKIRIMTESVRRKKIDELQKKIESLETLRKSTADNTDIHALRQSLAEKIDVLRKVSKEQNDELAMLQKNLDQLVQEHSSHAKRYREIVQELGTIQQKLEMAAACISSSQRQLEASAEQLSSLEQEEDKRKKILEEAKSTLQQADTKFKPSLDELHNEIKDIDGSIKELQNSLMVQFQQQYQPRIDFVKKKSMKLSQW